MASSPTIHKHGTFVFDVDGVVADTKPLVVEAYRRAGVDMPGWAWGRPWREWLDDPQVHAQKNIEYLRLLELTPPRLMAGAEIAGTLGHEHHVGFITSASFTSAVAVLDVAGIDHRLLIGSALSTEQKAEVLIETAGRDFSPPFAYVDDDHVAGAVIAAYAGWTFVPFVDSPWALFAELAWML